MSVTIDFIEKRKEILKAIEQKQVVSPEDRKLLQRVDAALKEFKYLQQLRGRRYVECRFSNYQSTTDAQRSAVEKLLEYSKLASQNIEHGKNIILFGCKGSGKDHLLMALARACVVSAATCPYWWNGASLFDKFRTEAAGNIYRREYIQINDGDEKKSDILWLSDPLTPGGRLSDFVESKLFELIDYRYSDLKPTWVSVNVANSDELAERIGSQAADRLRHDCLAIYCDWPSHRTGE